MTTPALTHIDNTQDVIRSHDVIDRIAELERQRAAAEDEGEPFDGDDMAELADLVDLELQCLDRAPLAWRTGTVLYRFDHDLWFMGDHDVDFAGVTYALRVG